MNHSVRRLLVVIVVAFPAGAAEGAGPCAEDGAIPCAAVALPEESRSGLVKLVAVLPAPGAAPRQQSLLAVIPSPPPRTLGARLWGLVQRGVQIDGAVRPDFDDRPPLPGGGRRGFELAMVGVKVRFGEEIATELWGEIVGIELLDHSLTLDGTLKLFE